jgi:predicted metal-dependent HD superfamily phosphohydrolase
MNHPELVPEAEAFVNSFFAEHATPELYFHNLEHTQNVVRRSAEISEQEGVTESEKTVIRLAAWFHDTGHLTGSVENHEARSVEIMKEFMAAHNVTDMDFIEQVAKCIMVTKLPHHPTGLCEQIMCDADVYHFGTTEFQSTNKAVKKELFARGYEDWTTDWLQQSFRILASQHYFTRYCQDALASGKQENIAWITRKLEKKGKRPDPALLSQVTEEYIAAKEDEKQNQRLVARGVQTVLRLASSNHLELSQMADGKANILISVNAIIISVILSVLIRRLDIDPYLTIPTMLFLTSSVTTTVLAILATRPKLTEGTFTKEDILNRKTNLLFFGNFYKSSLQDYEWAMGKLLEDKDYIHGTQIMDVYFLGKVLGRKYKLIRLAYTVFMIGIIVSAVAFTVAVLMNSPRGNVTVIDGTQSPL